MNGLYVFFEIMFFIDMVSKFFLEYISVEFDNIKPVRNIKLIAIRYLESNFILDLIPIFPLTEMF
mgnify:CR=1 FL=1